MTNIVVLSTELNAFHLIGSIIKDINVFNVLIRSKKNKFNNSLFFVDNNIYFLTCPHWDEL